MECVTNLFSVSSLSLFGCGGYLSNAECNLEVGGCRHFLMVAAGGIKVGVMLGCEVFAYWPCIHCKLPQVRINSYGGGKRTNSCDRRDLL